MVIGECGKAALKVGPSDKENVTVLITINANGKLAPPLTIYPYQRVQRAILDNAPNNAVPKWVFGKTMIGWITAEAFYEFIANVFYSFLVDTKTQLPVIIFLGEHASHLVISILLKARHCDYLLACQHHPHLTDTN